MPRVSASLFADQYIGRYRSFQKLASRRMEAAALIATDKAAEAGKQLIRQQMASAGLGRLGYGLGSTSDLQRTGQVFRQAGGFSASGVIYVRGRSPRTRGAIEAYTQGAQILPKRGRWLWYATDQIPRVTGRVRMTPELYKERGFEEKIGPLVRVNGKGGTPLLIVRKVGVSAAGKKRSARAFNSKGQPRRGQVAAQFIVAFIGIPRTSRRARVNITQLMRAVQKDLPLFFTDALERTL